MKIKKFNDKAKCIKCGDKIIVATYHKEDKPSSICWCEVDGEQNIDRRCVRCGYEWIECVLKWN